MLDSWAMSRRPATSQPCQAESCNVICSWWASDGSPSLPDRTWQPRPCSRVQLCRGRWPPQAMHAKTCAGCWVLCLQVGLCMFAHAFLQANVCVDMFAIDFLQANAWLGALSGIRGSLGRLKAAGPREQACGAAFAGFFAQLADVMTHGFGVIERRPCVAPLALWQPPTACGP